jgi:C4-type Zn-finger protein
VSKKPADSMSFVGTERVEQSESVIGAATMEEDVPYYADIEEFQYAYKCKHCGHEWSEIHEEEYVEKEPKGYIGD